MSQQHGISARPYHAGLEAAIKEDAQRSWMADETRVICATIAFGMGIDKQNVRWVLHWDPPCNLESLLQEAGQCSDCFSSRVPRRSQENWQVC